MEEFIKVKPAANGFKSRIEAVASVIMWEDIKTEAVKYSDTNIQDYLIKAQERIDSIARKNEKNRRQFSDTYWIVN